MLKDVTEDNNYASSIMAKHSYKMPEADKKAIVKGGYEPRSPIPSKEERDKIKKD